MALDSLIRVITRVLFSAIEDRIDRYSPGVVLDYDGEGRAGPAKNRAGKKLGPWPCFGARPGRVSQADPLTLLLIVFFRTVSGVQFFDHF